MKIYKQRAERPESLEEAIHVLLSGEDVREETLTMPNQLRKLQMRKK